MKYESDEKKCTYYIDVLERAPKPGEYMVWVGKKGINQVLMIKSVKAVKHKVVTDTQAYHLKLQPMNHLKELTVIDEKRRMGVVVSCQAWVRGEEAWPCYWHPRSKKR